MGKSAKIRDAALAEFAARGVEATSLRQVAARGGVSIGLVQHHFGSKAGLVEAVDAHVADVVGEVLVSAPEAVTVEAFGDQLMALLTQHSVVAEYLARAMADKTPFGSMIFDRLIAMGVARWKCRSGAGRTCADVDTVWAVMNVVVLFIGTILLRPHVERQLSAPLLSPDQVVRWRSAVAALTAKGVSLTRMPRGAE
ncbi:TetR/AcrR family transcriptional regulator (plasmid) [Mycobacterium avium subsp. hominissuis]|uniref:TetR/AcrR family transcriptional regulator n=1 Tax=Mycobacterium avium TaxID=1764 RepID=UPI0031409EB8